jgi:hypothetical protein
LNVEVFLLCSPDEQTGPADLIGMTVVLSAPLRLLGASDGQNLFDPGKNEDELRPTAGFITAAGTLVVMAGVLSLSFTDSGMENECPILWRPGSWKSI